MNLITMSITGGVMILATMAIRLLGLRKLPKTTFTALWAIVTLRLLIPFSLPFDGSVYTMLANLPWKAQSDAAIGISNMEFTFYAVSRTVANAPAQIAAATPSGINPLIVIWLSGAALLALYFVFSYFRIRRRFSIDYTANCQDAIRATGIKTLRPVTVYVSSAVNVPLTYGVLHPVIMLPKGTDLTDTERLRAVLAHELIHIKRFHAVYKPLLIAALCVHWFNPLVWVMLILANRDIELLCDEAVLQALGAEEKTVYARVLLEMEEQKAGLIPMFNSFSKYAIEERICSIMSFKRISTVAIVFALVLIVGVTAVFATSRSKDNAELETAEADLAYLEEELADFEREMDENEHAFLQELADAEQKLTDAEQEMTENEQAAMQELADAMAALERELAEAGVEPRLVAFDLVYDESVTGKDGEPVPLIEELDVHIQVNDSIYATNGMRVCMVIVQLPNGDSQGLGADTEDSLKQMVLDYLDGKVVEGVITQDEADVIFTEAMNKVTFQYIKFTDKNEFVKN